MGVGPGVPDFFIDPVENAMEHVLTVSKQAFKSHSLAAGLNLRGIGRRHRGDLVSKMQASFEESNVAVEFETIAVEPGGRQAERIEQKRREQPLETKVMDGDNRRRPPTLGRLQIER